METTNREAVAANMTAPTTDTTPADVSPSASTSATPADGTIGGHYSTVPPLPCPPGALPALHALVATANTAIQTAVDLLGQRAEPPPQVHDLMSTVTITNLGQNTATTQYQQALTAVTAEQRELLARDEQVVQVASVVAAANDNILAGILDLVGKMAEALQAAGTGQLTSTQEAPLMDEIARVVDAIYTAVSNAAQSNAQMAAGASDGSGGSSVGGGDTTAGGTPTTDQATGSGAGGGLESAIAQIAPMLLMAGVAAIGPLTSLASEWIKANGTNNKHDDPKNPDGSPQAPGTPPQPGTPTPATPEAPATSATPSAPPAVATAPPASPGATTPPGTTPGTAAT
ncbi:hypothetical protein [Nocardia tengchongensis]|uniref:hypothetical protein n=1 Tax=Nocardia tengchongensis TaxID=2055889 RepID=UPI0036AB2194